MFFCSFFIFSTGQLLVHVMPCCTIHYASYNLSLRASIMLHIICHYVLFCMTLCCIWEIHLIWFDLIAFVTLCFFVFCLLVVLARLSVPVQVIDWKNSSPKWPEVCWWPGDVKPYSLTNSSYNCRHCRSDLVLRPKGLAERQTVRLDRNADKNRSETKNEAISYKR